VERTLNPSTPAILPRCLSGASGAGRAATFYEGRQFVVTKVPPLGEVVCVARWGVLPPTTLEQLPPREGFLCLRVFTSFT